jgi:hypothetical protein
MRKIQSQRRNIVVSARLRNALAGKRNEGPGRPPLRRRVAFPGGVGRPDCKRFDLITAPTWQNVRGSGAQTSRSTINHDTTKQLVNRFAPL